VGANEPKLADLADAILDGTPIDWLSVQSGSEAAERLLLDQLQLLAVVVELHRDRLVPPHVAPVRWGHLRVLEPIGRGAFGEVYRAWDTRLDREVALKLLPAGSDAVNDRGASIIEEGRLLARVRHPNVVTIYGAERIGDRVGLWMEFVKGRTLAQAIADDGLFTVAKAVDIGIEIAHAIGAVHKAGLLHRDVKAHNVMLSEDGRVVLMDFGSGRELADAAVPLAGTPLYLAPELLDGTKASVASDIYSVGVLLYYLLTGSYPVRAADMRDLRRAHALQERVDIRIARADVSPGLGRIIARAIDGRPAHRYENAEALASSLEALRPRPRAIRVTYALALASAVALVVWLGSQTRIRLASDAKMSAIAASDARSSPAAGTLDPRSRPVIAVLPLRNLSAERDSDDFVDGLTEELIRNLAVIEGLEVRSSTSSFAFKNKPRDLRDLAAQLGVNLVVEGSVLRSGSRLRINARLVTVARDTPLWSQHFDRELKDVFAIQDEIARAVVNELRLTLGRGQRRYNTNVAAYELYLNALALLDRRGEEGARKAAALFREVIVKDPAFAPAYAGLASAYAFMSMNPYASAVFLKTAQSVMRPNAIRALELDPLLAEAHAAMGIVHSSEFDWASAEKSFQRALELNPRLTQIATTYSFWTLEPLGRLDEARRLLEAASRSDPLSLDIRRELALVHFMAGRYELAVAELERARSVDPEFPFVEGNLARALIFAGRVEEAIPLLEKGGWPVQPFLAYAYVLRGRRADVEKMAAANKGYPVREARIYAALGDKNRAFDAVKRALIAEPQRVSRLLAYPEMAGLRGDPRFAELRKTLHLPPPTTSNPAGAAVR